MTFCNSVAVVDPAVAISKGRQLSVRSPAICMKHTADFDIPQDNWPQTFLGALVVDLSKTGVALSGQVFLYDSSLIF